MKKTLLFLFLLAPVVALCQSDTLTYAQTQDPVFQKETKNNINFAAYKTSDGSLLKIGDKIKFGTPTGGSTTQTVSTGSIFGGAKSKSSNNFQFLTQGKMTVGNMLLGITYLDQRDQNKEVIITEIRLSAQKVKNGRNIQVVLFTETPNTPAMLKNNTVLDYEKALEAGEVLNPNRAMTRAEAIAKLKETKDLLDLGMVKQDEYDAMKAKLTPIIMGSK